MNINRIVAPLVVALALAASASAQSRRWADPYQKGVQAFESNRFADAAAQFERAVTAEPKAEANKLIEGVYRTDYFPYYYLALTYVELQQFDKARQNLDKARTTATRQQQARLNDAESRIKIALLPKPAPRNAEFDSGVRDADALLSSKQFDAAIKRFDRLRSMDVTEYGKAGLASRRDEAVRGLAGQLTEEGRAALQMSRLREALARLQQADQLIPGQKPVTDLLAEIRKRTDDYRRLTAEAQAAYANQDYSSARDRLEQARTTHPEQFASDNLEARLAEVVTLGRGRRGTDLPADPGQKPPAVDTRMVEGQRFADTGKRLLAQGKYLEADAAFASALKADAKNRDALDAVEKTKKYIALRDQGLQLTSAKNGAAAQKMFVDARRLDAMRFERDGLAKTLDALTRSSGQESSRLALQEGLLALLKGDAEKSIAILEPAAADAGNSQAALHAYLGVAYASRALAAPKPTDRTRLLERANEQFKLAAAAQPGYRLSDRIVSPSIMKIYRQSR